MDSEIAPVREKQEKGGLSLHPIFTKDPAEWMKLVNHEIQVSTEDEQLHVGYVFTVDPVSESLVLITFADDCLDLSNISLKLIFGASVKDVKIISEGTEEIKQRFDHLFRPSMDKTLNTEEMNARKLKLKSWLEKHRLPVTQGGNEGQYLTVADALTIQPPYTEDSCLSTNEIILSRIQGLIKNMPDD